MMRGCTLAALGLAMTASAGFAADERRAGICAEAEQRCQQSHGKPTCGADVITYKYTFCPGQLHVKRGQTVRWVNVDRRTSHSVWFRDAGLSESERIFADEEIAMTIDLPPGEHRYICGPHANEDGMTAVLVVE